VGIRGIANVKQIDSDRLNRFVGKYLGYKTDTLNKWFVSNVVDPLNRMVEVEAHTIVAKNVSFFKIIKNHMLPQIRDHLHMDKILK